MTTETDCKGGGLDDRQESGAYPLDLAGPVFNAPPSDRPSNRVIGVLKAADPRVEDKSFRKHVLEAIFEDAVRDSVSDQARPELFRRRLHKWAGKSAQSHLIKRSEIMRSWVNPDRKFVPDAFLIDESARTVVCYEIEDTNPIDPFTIGRYAEAWWTLDAICWTLLLVAYDIYGHPRVLNFPLCEFIAQGIREARSAPMA